MVKIDDDNKEQELKQNAKSAAKKVKNNAKNAAKKVLKNKKVKAFIAAHLPLIIGIIVVIIIIIFLMGIVMLLITMPGLILGKLDELGGKIWGNFSGFFTGDSTTAKVTKQDVLDLAQYMENMGYDIQTYGLGEVTYKDDGKTLNNRNGKTREIEKIGKTVDGKNYLEAYIAADENTYVLSQFNLFGTVKSAIDQIFDNNQDSAEIRDAKTSVEGQSTGMINIEGYDDGILKTANSGFVEIDRENKQMKVYTNALKASNLVPIQLRMHAKIFNRTFFETDSIKWGEVFRYDLENWSARYGRPKELMLAIHLSTMMPDLAYTIATSEDFNTKVNIGIQDVNLTYDVEATKDDETLSTSEIVNLFLDNCLGTGDTQEKDSGKETTLKVNNEYKKMLNKLDSEERDKFFKQIWKQIDSGAIRQFTNFYGINFLSTELKANGELGAWDSVFVDVGDSIVGKILELYGKDSDTYIYFNASDNKIPGTDWTYNEIIYLAGLAYKGNLGQVITDDSGKDGDVKKGITDVKWPFIRSITKHWYYKDIDFTKNTYRLAKTATKTIDYKPENKDNVLAKNNISIKLNATLQSETGIIYQVCEPEAEGPNDSIVKVFKDKYYTYDGSEITAKRIANTKAIEENKKTYKYGGEKYQIDNSDNMKVEKKKVNFEKNKTNTFSAFSILGNMHTEAADFIYRNLKELVVKLGYFSENDMQEDLKAIALWPVKTDNQYTKWETSKSTNDYGEIIKCTPGENTIIAPSEATIEKIENNSITLNFTTINQETKELYDYIYNKKDNSKYSFTTINNNILTGMKLTISNINIDSSIAANQQVYRGQQLGTAVKKTDGSYEIKITMQNLDKSIIEDLSDYFRQEHNTKYEEIMKYQMKNQSKETGIDIGKFGSGASDGSGYYLDSTVTSGTLSYITTTTISKNDFVNLTKEYANKKRGQEFAANAETLYDVCVKNNINPVWCAAQAWIEQGWVIPKKGVKNNYWGLGVYNHQNYGNQYPTFTDGVQAYCNNIKKRLNSEKKDALGTLAWSKRLKEYDSQHFHGKISSIYDVLSNYAFADDGDINYLHQAQHASNYANQIIKQTSAIYGKYGIN